MPKLVAEFDALTQGRTFTYAEGGTPYLVGSRRTPPGFLDRLQTGFPDTLRVFDWARPEGEWLD